MFTLGVSSLLPILSVIIENNREEYFVIYIYIYIHL